MCFWIIGHVVEHSARSWRHSGRSTSGRTCATAKGLSVGLWNSVWAWGEGKDGGVIFNGVGNVRLEDIYICKSGEKNGVRYVLCQILLIKKNLGGDFKYCLPADHFSWSSELGECGKYVSFSPQILGEDEPILTCADFFQMGWLNHQPENPLSKHHFELRANFLGRPWQSFSIEPWNRWRKSSDVKTPPKNGSFLSQQLIPKKISAFETPPKKNVSNLPKQYHLSKKHTNTKNSTILFWNQVFSKRHPWAPLVCEVTLPNISDDFSALLAKMPRRKGVERQLLRALVEGCSYEAAWQRLPRKQRWLELWFKGKMDGVGGK